MKHARDEFRESEHPRGQPGNPGQFAPSPGGGKGGEHPGKGYSKNASVKNGVVHTDNVRDATRALYEGKKVQLNQPREVSTLIDRLGKVTKEFSRLGAKAPIFDLCNVSVPDTNLFCGESLGIPRAKMPQIPYDKLDEFKDSLESKGYSTKKDTEYAEYLRATQGELNGAKVAQVLAKLNKGDPEFVNRPVIVSKDNYILDGHHKWAAKIGQDAGGEATKMNVARIDIGITDLLQEAETFTGGKGKRGVGTTSASKPDFKGSLAFETKEDTTQPVKSLDDLYERAKKGEKKFKEEMQFIADNYGSEVSYTPPEYAEPGTILKSRTSAERKVNGELEGDVTKLRDVIRATIVSTSVEDTRKAAAAFIGQYGKDILRVKDRVMSPIGGGYRDILINYRTSEGLVAEVQFNSKNMVKAKNEEAHALYEEARALKNPTAEQLEHLEQQMAALYEKAYQADGDGKGWKTEHQAHDSAENVPLRRYRITPPDDPSFEAAVVSQGGTLSVITNRSGEWKPETGISFADLIAPEQSLGAEWDVERIDPGTIEQPQDKSNRRAVDRSADAADIEYYTSEKLGPRRERTPEGFLICYDVPVARIGEMLYGPGEVPDELGMGRDGRIHVVRSPSAVFDKRSMASLNGKPITDDHPPVDVEPGNWHYYTKGVVVSPRRGEGDLSDFLIADLIVYDKDMIEDIDAGKREVSCGYNPDYLQILDEATGDPIPGRGEQVNILYNHLALVMAGRCGPYCAIGDRKTVDSSDDAFFTPERTARFRRLLRRL